MTVGKARSRRSQRYTGREFLPYVTALGQLALAWNDLQESFKELFWTAMLPGPPQAGDSYEFTALYLWNCIPSDRQQRKMLRAVLDCLPGEWNRPNFISDATDALNDADRLEDWRNDAVHSPLFYAPKSLHGLAVQGGDKVVPVQWLFNPRAVKLAQREDLLSEFRYVRDAALALSDYIRAMNSALVNSHKPWPKKQTLLARSGKSPVQGRRTQRHGARKRPPRSSRA
jgi:hypothetical protein